MNRLFASAIPYTLEETDTHTVIVVDGWNCVCKDDGFDVTKPLQENEAKKVTPEQAVFFLKYQRAQK